MVSSGDGAGYTVTVAPLPGAEGELTITVPAGVATDPAGNPNTASETLSFALAPIAADGVAPSACLSPPTPVWSATLTLGYDGFGDKGFGGDTTGGSLSDDTFSYGGTDYTVEEITHSVISSTHRRRYIFRVAPTPELRTMEALTLCLGSVELPFQGRGFQMGDADYEWYRDSDSSSPFDEAAGSEILVHLIGSSRPAAALAAPTVTVASEVERPVSEHFAVTVAFSAPVRGFDLTDLEITNGSAEGMLSTAGQRVFTVQVAPRPDAGGSLTITVPAGAAMDAAGNPTTAAGTLTLVIAAGPANGALAVAGAIPDQALEEGGAPVTLDLAPFFTAAASASLAFEAVSSAPAVATAEVAGTTLRLAPVVRGAATVTVTARDAEGRTATQVFGVTVGDRLVRAAAGNTLAGRGHLSSARLTIGRRLEAAGPGATRVTVGGQRVPLGMDEAAQMRQAFARRWLMAAAAAARTPDPLQQGAGALLFAGQFSGDPDRLLQGTDILLGFGGDGPAAGGGRSGGRATSRRSGASRWRPCRFPSGLGPAP